MNESERPERIQTKWQEVKRILYPSASNTSATSGGFTPNSFVDFFIQKVWKYEDLSTLHAFYWFGDPLDDDSPYVGNPWTSISPVTIFEVSKLIASMSGKTSPLDLIPTNILKACSDVFSPILWSLQIDRSFKAVSHLVSRLLRSNQFLKKPGMDEDVLAGTVR